MKLYAYCLTEGPEGIAALPEALRGIGGAPVRLFETEHFSLLVSDFPGGVVAVNRDSALVHAAVVRSVLDRTTPLPFRFGTLGTEDQLRSYVNARRNALLKNLELVRGCVEMNVKIISEAREELPGDQHLQDKPGTAFLNEKRREILGSEARAAAAKSVAGWLEGLVGESVRTGINTDVKGKLLLALAHLVERDSVGKYRERLKTARNERPDLKFLVSGPWPPYSFTKATLENCNIDLEFRKQFGVS